ncbi:MAG: Swarming motility protein SwrC [Firmicutes bacterium]|nr:Swarming motility protein SwrC [candidate division NPL-UPA2 bacterium]
MSLPAFATSRRITVLMLVLVTVVIGVMSYSRTPVDLLPNMSFPMAAVFISFPGAAPQEVETLVTRPLEGTLATVSNIREVSSTSSAGQATVLLSFNWGTDMDFAALEMREKIDLVRRMLPAEVGSPTVMKFDPSLMPIMSVDIGSNTRTAAELRDLADRVLAARLERVQGVASVTVSGGQQSVIQVRLDPQQLERLGVTLGQVTGTLRTASLNLPDGALHIDGREYLIRSVGQLTSLAAIEDLIVGMRAVRTVVTTTFEPVRLREVGEVLEVNTLGNAITLLNTLPSVSIRLHKQSDANTVLVANLVHAELVGMRTDFSDLTLVPTQDQSRFIEAAISAVGQNAIYGGLLAVAILFFFLKSLASTLIIAIAVPVSVVATFALMYFGNLSINLMTLMGLALGIGMLVDNSIVVLENIFRHQEEGAELIAAARQGTEEVAMAITASTLTTVAVFLPIAFVGGITGLMFRELALTVSFSLLASLAVALIVVPMLSATITKARPRRVSSNGRQLNYYQRSLKWALGKKAVVALVTLSLLVGSLLTFSHIGGEFIPSMDQGEMSVTVTLPVGSTLADTQATTREILDYLLARAEVETVSTAMGAAGGGRGPMGAAQGRANRASMTVVLKPGYRGDVLAGEITEKYADFAPARVRASAAAGMGGGGMMSGGNNVQLNVSGPSLEGLRLHTDRLKEVVAAVEGVAEVRDNAAVGANELVVRVDREKAARLGLAPVSIAQAVRTAFQGETVARLPRDGRELDVNVSLADSARQSVTDLENLVVAATQGQVVRLKQVAVIEHGVGPASINRRANQRYISITGTIAGRDLQSVSRDLQVKLDALELPADYRVEIAGDMMEMQEAFSGLITALILAVVLVYMVMAAQFESLLYPLIVMFTMPLAVIGVLFALFFAGQNFNVPSVMGIIVLAGIVVNNAIVLVDYINQLRTRGRDVHAAIIEAAGARLRAILMTTATTVLGLIPMALLGGSGTEMQRPLSIAIIGGLTVSTLLTLYVIPVAYDLATLRRREA